MQKNEWNLTRDYLKIQPIHCVKVNDLCWIASGEVGCKRCSWELFFFDFSGGAVAWGQTDQLRQI
jgi:hypothetical protein